MNTEKENIYEYEQILIGNSMRFKSSFRGTKEENLKEAGAIWRYAITELLGWTPKQAEKYLDESVVKMLCLDKTYNGIDIDPKKMYLGGYEFILKYAFPDEIKFNFEAQTIDEYEKVNCIGKYKAYSKEDKDLRYPKKFFTDDNGTRRAAILLNNAINKYLRHMTKEELYDFFGNKSKANKWLREINLAIPVTIMYGTPFEYFHNSLDSGFGKGRHNNLQQDDFLYYAKAIENTCNQMIKAAKKEQKKNEE